MTKTRICKNCAQEKAFEKGEWRWASRYGPYGNICLSCHLHNDRPKNREQHARQRKMVKHAMNESVAVARENRMLRKRLERLLRETKNDY